MPASTPQFSIREQGGPQSPWGNRKPMGLEAEALTESSPVSIVGREHGEWWTRATLGNRSALVLLPLLPLQFWLQGMEGRWMGGCYSVRLSGPLKVVILAFFPSPHPLSGLSPWMVTFIRERSHCFSCGDLTSDTALPSHSTSDTLSVRSTPDMEHEIQTVNQSQPQGPIPREAKFHPAGPRMDPGWVPHGSRARPA